ncbi:carboxylesterase family protein [Oceaniserpentilla sp. 4NH20-0058]|uniref:carboxylesterase/lipase family protein n=1 Tax=Oceaniserpentilla sp. 4NH20-0058 TaxID=3127660 RepID=UPI00310A519D
MNKSRILGTAASYISCAVLSLALVGCGSSSNDKEETPPVVEPPVVAPPEVTTEQGTIEGVQEDSLISFKGIKYAAAPTGDLRFKAPTAPPALTETQVADSFGSNCPQKDSGFGGGSTNEDCLFLNVYTPDTDGDYPVMVWIHGGAFVYGSGSDYDPTRLVDEDVVVVTLNYRLGALGFLAHPELTAEASAGSGNYGLMDQQFALHWIQDNISVFGGNPDNVTIFGESAGGHSVTSQLVATGHEGLFHKAIIQSGNYHLEQQSQVLAEDLGNNADLVFPGTGYATLAGCATTGEDLTCLRGKTVTQLLAAQTQDQYIPTSGTGNGFLPVTPETAIAAGDFADVSIMNGTNLNEGTLFTALEQGDALTNALPEGVTSEDATDAQLLAAFFVSLGFLDTEDEYLAIVNDLFLYFPALLAQSNHTITEIAAEYAADFTTTVDGTTTVDYYKAASKIHTDWRFACTALNTNDQLAEHATVYAYHFTDTTAPNILGDFEPIYLGATHSAEIQYLLSDGTQFNTEQQALSDAMIDYWTSFAKTGNPNPNNSDLVTWTEFGTNGAMIDLNTTLAATTRGNFNTTHKCDYWPQATAN